MANKQATLCAFDTRLANLRLFTSQSNAIHCILQTLLGSSGAMQTWMCLQAQRKELAAWKQEQEADIAAKAEDSGQRLQRAQQQETALEEQQRHLRAQAAAQAELQVELQALKAQFGDAEATAARAAELEQLQEELAARRAEV